MWILVTFVWHTWHFDPTTSRNDGTSHGFSLYFLGLLMMLAWSFQDTGKAEEKSNIKLTTIVPIWFDFFLPILGAILNPMRWVLWKRQASMAWCQVTDGIWWRWWWWWGMRRTLAKQQSSSIPGETQRNVGSWDSWWSWFDDDDDDDDELIDSFHFFKAMELLYKVHWFVSAWFWRPDLGLELRHLDDHNFRICRVILAIHNFLSTSYD